MAIRSSRGILVVGALIFGLLAIGLGPLRALLVQTLLDYSINPPPFLLPYQPVVIDVERDVKYIGSYSYGVEHFQNIFYADDTAGKSRFAPPVPTRPRKGSVIDATQPGAWCPQGTGDILPFTSKVTNISENCLSLRIARPAGTKPRAKLPVMVWLHGGGHALGSGSDLLYTPDGLVRQAVVDGQPVIWVAINYRFGIFGFATSKTIVDAKHANNGLRDQRAAFEWVRDNIGSFGGDPQRLTAIGQSVGAIDISLQMTAFGGEQGAPFQQAIMMSGGPGTNFNTESSFVADNTAAVAKELGCVKGDSQSIETLECLREVPFQKLTNVSVTAARTAHPEFGEAYFFPTFDGDFLPGRPSELVRAGKIAKGVPVIAAWVANDGSWYPSPAISTDEEVLASFGRFMPGLSDSTNQRLLELYPVEDFEHMVRPEYDGPISAQYYRAAQMNRDIWFSCPVIDFAWQYTRKGDTDSSQVWLYTFNSTRYTPTFEMIGVPMWRVSHLSDIPYILNVQHLPGGADNSAAQFRLGATVSRDIVKFVTSGDPSGSKKGESSTKWPPTFADATKDELKKADLPESLLLQVLGGPYGNIPVTVSRGNTPQERAAVDEAVRWEKIMERCDFISNDQVRQEM